MISIILLYCTRTALTKTPLKLVFGSLYRFIVTEKKTHITTPVAKCRVIVLTARYDNNSTYCMKNFMLSLFIQHVKWKNAKRVRGHRHTHHNGHNCTAEPVRIDRWRLTRKARLQVQVDLVLARNALAPDGTNGKSSFCCHRRHQNKMTSVQGRVLLRYFSLFLTISQNLCGWCRNKISKLRGIF